MNAGQDALRIGYIANLSINGRGLVTEDGKTFTAIIGFSPVNTDEFTTGETQRTDGVIEVLRETFKLLDLAEQDTLDEAEQSWRIVMIEDNPSNICVLLHCNLE